MQITAPALVSRHIYILLSHQLERSCVSVCVGRTQANRGVVERKKERLGANLAAILCYLCRLSGYFTQVFSLCILEFSGDV